MSDLISRQAAIDAVMELIEAGYEWRSGVSRKISLLNAVYCALEDIPSAEPVRHGKWIYENNYKCSLCGKWIDVLRGTAGMRYCPHCGARMDEDVQTKNDRKVIDEEIERAWEYAEAD